MDKRDGGISRPIHGSDDGNQEGVDSFQEDSSDCAVSCLETELEDDDVRDPNLKFKSDCAPLHLDSMGRVNIHFNEPLCGDLVAVEAQDNRNEDDSFKEAHSNLDLSRHFLKDQ